MTQRTRIAFDDDQFVLEPEQDLVDLMERIESAARSDPGFVDFVSGERMVSVLVCASTRVVVTVDPRPATDESCYLPPTGGQVDWEY